MRVDHPRRRAFTVVELLVVIAIIAILAAFIFPVFLSAKGAVVQMGSSRAAKQIFTATTVYQADYDDAFPIAFYYDGHRMVTWFGRQSESNELLYDAEDGLLGGYMRGKLGADQTLVAGDYIGDSTGIGYNWGVIGSDMHITGNYSDFPNCKNPATTSQLSSPSRTLVFATSAYYNVRWRPGGTGEKLKFNFFDPIEAWDGVPNVDFRHISQPRVDEEGKTIKSQGNAVMLFADGNARTYGMSSVKSWWFWRDQEPQ